MLDANKMNDEGVKALMAAVVERAVKDYENALYNYNTVKKKDKKEAAKNMISGCEIFFRKDISTYSDIDGIRIMNAIRERVEKQLLEKGILMEVP